MKEFLLLMFSICIFFIESVAQIEDYDDEHIESSLPNFSGFNVNTEYYKFNTIDQAIYIPVNGKIEFGNSDYLNIELVSTWYNKDNSWSHTLGDFNISYTKNFYSDKFHNSGYQGISPSLKLFLPTGNSDYTGLFGHWIIEPSLYYSWLLKNEKFFFSNRWRVFLPAWNAQDAAEPPQFLRFEPRIGFENSKLWVSLTLDNRYVFNMEEYVLFVRGDFGYKLNEKSGISTFFTKRIHNTVLFNVYAGLGYYYIF